LEVHRSPRDSRFDVMQSGPHVAGRLSRLWRAFGVDGLVLLQAPDLNTAISGYVSIGP
jgi:hypothetical protein